MKPTVLIVMDGWGIAPEGPGNAVALAKTPNIDQLIAAYPSTQLTASGEAVGLPKGEVGNSETGHLNLGAGQIVFQDLPRISLAIAEGTFFKNKALLGAVNYVKEKQSALHLMGLISPSGVHASLEHLFALLHLAKDQGIPNVFLHLFTDGRDSPPTSSINILAQVENFIRQNQVGKIATICGRYYGMDRDSRWDRTQVAYEAILEGKGTMVFSPSEALANAYKTGETDEFLKPLVVSEDGKNPVGLISDNDAVVFFNFRIDRPRQLTKAIILPDFENLKEMKAKFDPYAEKYGLHVYQTKDGHHTFKRNRVAKGIFFVTMTEYEKGLPVSVAFPPETIKMPLARVISDNGFRQLHIAETEKEKFITYYFDGQRENPFSGEDQLEVPSPNVATYDLKPEMSAYEITEELLRRIDGNIYDFIVVNYANPDMVGHTGVLPAGVRACEVVDECVGKVVKTVLTSGGCCVITADHGNVEEMINLKTGKIDTEHSSNPVPFILVAEKYSGKNISLPTGVLADVAPTILKLMGIEKPSLMSGNCLISL